MSGYPPPEGDYPPQYPPPQQGYPPPQQGYPPPQQGYPPPQQGYPPPQQSYPPPQQGYAQPAQQQQQSNVVVVQAGQPQVVSQTTVVQKRGPNHCLHCVLTFLFPPWIIVWVLVCICDGC